MKPGTSCNNPFITIVERLPTEFIPINIGFLNDCMKAFSDCGSELLMYSDVVYMLEFLHKHGAVVLVSNPDNTLHIKKATYGN